MTIWAFVRKTGCPLASDGAGCSICPQNLDVIRIKLWVRDNCAAGEHDILEVRADSITGWLLMLAMRVRKVPTFIAGGKRVHSADEVIAELVRAKAPAAGRTHA